MEIFKDKKQKKQSIISSLEELKQNTGWLVVTKALKANVEAAEARLHGDIKLEDDETIEHWQKVRSDRLQMIELPDTLIEENKDKEAFPVELDPYD